MRNPKALEYFARILSSRLASVTRGEVARRATTTIAVTSKPGLKGKSLVARSLAELLEQLTGAEVLLVRIRRGYHGEKVARLLSDDIDAVPEQLRRELAEVRKGAAMLEVGIQPDRTASFYGDRATNLIVKLGELFTYMVFDLGSEPQALVDSVGEFADVWVEIVESPSTPGNGESAIRHFEVINQHNPGSRRVPLGHCEPFIIPDDSSLGNNLAGAVRTICENSRSPVALSVHRLARKLVGSSVGLALGGGAAFGIAHLGVLRVLEQNNIPIDLVAGCSQGSIIGVGYAAGIGVEEMVDIALDLGQKKNVLKPLDLTMTKPGLLAGNRMVGIFSPLLESKETFEDLVLPCRTVATDIESGERVSIGTGRLDQAFRASSSVPMVFAPMRWEERALVDGGVVDPVPAEVVQEMGADICIAINVVPPLKKGVETVIANAYRQLNRFNPLSYIGDSRFLPNMFDIIMNSMQVLQYELGNFKAISADVRINPDLSDFTWIEYYRSAELIERGEEATERALPAIRKALDGKLAAARGHRSPPPNVRTESGEKPAAEKTQAKPAAKGAKPAAKRSKSRKKSSASSRASS